MSNGFRAPTLAEEYYSATNVSPTSAIVQLPANSAAAKLLGFHNLRPEKSTNFSFGAVFRPAPRLTLTVDAYQIRIRDRILGSGTVFGSGGATELPDRHAGDHRQRQHPRPDRHPDRHQHLHQRRHDPDARHRGGGELCQRLRQLRHGQLDDLGQLQRDEVDLRRRPAPAQLGGISLFDQTTRSLIENGSPKVKIIGSAFWSLGMLLGDAARDVLRDDVGTAQPERRYLLQQPRRAGVHHRPRGQCQGDEVDPAVARRSQPVNRKPPTVFLVPNPANPTLPTISSGGNVFDAPIGVSPYGNNGGYYYGRINFAF